MRKPREVIITHKVITRAPLSLLRKTAAYGQIVICKGLEVYSMELLESSVRVSEPWEEKEGKVK